MVHIHLPIVAVQPDFQDVIKDIDDAVVPEDKFWVSCYKTRESSVHSEVHVELDQIRRDLVTFHAKQADLEFVKSESGHCNVSCKALDIPPTQILTSAQDYKDPDRNDKITALGVSPDSTGFATGYLDGSVYIYPSTPLSDTSKSSSQKIDTSKRQLVSKPHVSNITSLTFFPSSRVLLSTAADSALSIIAAEFPDSWPTTGASSRGIRIQPVRVFKSHTRTVTSARIIGLGRNIISTSLDSTLKLWDVPSGGVISTVRVSGPITCSTISSRIPTPPGGGDFPLPTAAAGTPTTDEREMPEIAYTTVYTGLQTGIIQVLDLRSRSSTEKFTPPSSSPINAISHLPSQNLLATGTSDGIVALFDIRSSTSPLTSFRRNEACINDLSFIPRRQSSSTATSPGNHDSNSNIALAIATSDGLPFIANIMPDGVRVQAELIGVDCDSVSNICTTQQCQEEDVSNRIELWAGSYDGVVRRYYI